MISDSLKGRLVQGCRSTRLRTFIGIVVAETELDHILKAEEPKQ